MKIRFISDIHYWLNLRYSFEALTNILDSIEPADVTLIAGDLDTDKAEAAEFFQKYFPNEKVVFVGGNHMVYNTKRQPITDLIDSYKKQYFGKYKFLENDYTWLNDDIAVIGTIGWTDFLWGWKTKSQYVKEINEEKEFRKNFKPEYMEEHPEEYDWSRPVVWIPELPENPAQDYEERLMGNKKSFQGHRMKDALRNMNDYNYGRVYRGHKVDFMYPSDTLKMHKKALKEIKRCYEEIIAKNPNATIILMTHHPFVSKCESARFKGDPLNAAFMSDHDRWLKKFKNIKYIHCGHVHSRFFDKLGDKEIICNPMGYLHSYEEQGEVLFDINYTKEIK